jgi:hypothetical protein
MRLNAIVTQSRSFPLLFTVAPVAQWLDVVFRKHLAKSLDLYSNIGPNYLGSCEHFISVVLSRSSLNTFSHFLTSFTSMWSLLGLNEGAGLKSLESQTYSKC